MYRTSLHKNNVSGSSYLMAIDSIRNEVSRGIYLKKEEIVSLSTDGKLTLTGLYGTVKLQISACIHAV